MRLTLVACALLALALPASAQTTWPEDRIARARALWERNAASTGADHMDCITTLNAALRELYEDPFLELGSQIDHTFTKLQGAGLAGAARIVDFKDERGRNTTGVTAPKTLRESVYDAAIAMTGGARGWHVFGLSLMDGYHSVALTFDLRDPAAPKVYWCDQWSSNGGFRLHDKASLDAEITRLTSSWWSEEKKPRSRTTLWKTVPSNRSRVAVTSSAVNLRASPSTSASIVGKTVPGQRYRILERAGQWVKVELPDGRTAYVHGTLVRSMRATMPPRELPAAPVNGLVNGIPTQ